MNRLLRTWWIFVCLGAVLAAWAPATTHAQDDADVEAADEDDAAEDADAGEEEEDAADDEAAEDEGAEDAEADEAPARPAAGRQPRGAAEAPEEVDPPTSPELENAAQALLETNPTTPEQLVRGADTLIRLQHPRTARKLVKKLLDKKPKPATLMALAREFGTGTFLTFAVRPELQPEGRQLAEAVRQAVEKETRDPARIADLISKATSDPEREVRQRAIMELRRGGETSSAALVAALADPARAAQHAALRDAIVGQGKAAVAPLVAARESSDAALQSQVAECLGRLGDKDAAVYLLAPAVSPDRPATVRQAASAALERLLGHAPTPREAASILNNHARQHYASKRPLNPDAENQVVLWHWDFLKKAPVASRMLADDASLDIAGRLAGDLLELLPDNESVRRLYLGSRLEADAYAAGLDQPLPQDEGSAYAEAVAAGPLAIDDLLVESLANEHPRAATAAAQVLGDIGGLELLERQSPQPSALVRAAQSPDPRLRFAALEAIMKLAPVSPYPGSSYVLDALAFFSRAGGRPRALVGDTRNAEGQKLAGLLEEMGYDTQVTNDGRELVRMAAEVPYDLILIDIHLPRWPVEQVLQQLRRDAGNGGAPVGLVAPLGEPDAALGFGRGDRRSMPFIRPVDPHGMQFQVGRLMELVGREQLTDAERNCQAAQAVTWLAALSQEPGGSSPYDLRRVETAMHAALTRPELAEQAIGFLSRLDRATAQQALVELASRNVEPLALRQAAASGFRDSASRFGTLLTADQIQLQYDRYNASETLDQETQSVLGLLLDVIEAGRAPSLTAVSPAAEEAPPAGAPAPP